VEGFVIKRTVIVLALFLLPLAAAAQNNELSVFISTSQFDDSEINDAGDIFDVEFDEEMGVGASYNRYWMGGFSTELAYQRLGADLTLSAGDIAQDVAEIDLDVLSATAQLHFARNSMLSPYIGAGVAYISGEAGGIDQNELESADLENEVEFLGNAGVNLNLGRRFAVFLDGKYIVYEARGENDPDDQGVDVNPLIIAGGIRFRF
jgi:opacity protein-like surface antigen